MNPFRREMQALQTTERVPIRAERPDAKTSESGVVTLRLYEPLDSYGGFWGVSAKEFAAAVDDIPQDTTEIRLLINSPGGEVWEGLSVLNMLRAHPAKIVAIVEGIAASSASFIATGADELHMMKNSELFVHNAWGLCVGNSADMSKMATDLTHEDRNIASIYAAKAGGTVDDWLTAMGDETWYSAEEAVSAGLADRVVDSKDDGAASKAKARFDLSVFNHSGRIAARQKPPAEPADPPHPNPEGADMASDHLIQGLRDRLGISAEASLDDDGILAAVDEALAEQPTARPGTVTMDAATLADLQAAAEQGRQARAQQVADRRNALISAAIDDGRITPARREHWLNALAADPEGAEQTLAGLAKGLVPLAAVGYTGGVEESSDDDRIYALAFGKEA